MVFAMEAKKVTFTDARHIARMTRTQVMDYLQISKSTLVRYEKTNKTPKAVIECLLMIGGQCPTFSIRNDFSGWSFGQGFLWSPEGDKFTSGDVRAFKKLQEIISVQDQEIKALKARRNSPLPSNVIPFPIRLNKNKKIG